MRRRPKRAQSARDPRACRRRAQTAALLVSVCRLAARRRRSHASSRPRSASRSTTSSGRPWRGRPAYRIHRGYRPGAHYAHRAADARSLQGAALPLPPRMRVRIHRAPRQQTTATELLPASPQPMRRSRFASNPAWAKARIRSAPARRMAVRPLTPTSRSGTRTDERLCSASLLAGACAAASRSRKALHERQTW